MYDLHCHSLLSDGVLLPSEVAVRYAAAGYKVIAITDHTDYSNIKTNVAAILEFVRHWPKNAPITVLAGIELSHLPPAQFKPLTQYARKQGIRIIVAHGETPAEPVMPGTNRAAIEAGIDILAHPGLITKEDARLAARKGVFLEITARKGHRDTNPYVAEAALREGAKLILNNDSHAPEDIITPEALKAFGRKAGLSSSEIEKIYRDIGTFLRQKEGR